MTPSVSHVVLLLSYSYKSKLRNLLACWFKVKLIFWVNKSTQSQGQQVNLKIVNQTNLMEF